MIEIFGTTYYTHGYATILFGVLSVMLIIGSLIVVGRVPKQKRTTKGKYFALMVGLLMALFGALHWDILFVGHQVTNLCKEEGGLNVYKTVEADGVVGLYDAEYWSEYGFSYVEKVALSGAKIRSSIVDGVVEKKSVEEFKSQYELKSETEFNVARYAKKSLISKEKYTVVDRKTKEVLGEHVYFLIGQGWADHWLPMTYTPWQCGKKVRVGKKMKHFTGTDLVKTVIKPTK